MTYRKIDTTRVKPETNTDFAQIQNDLAKFKRHTPMPENDVKTLMNYISKFERLIADESYQELEYSAECFMCRLRDILTNMKREPRKEAMVKCADSMGITVQKTNGVLEVTLPMILPTKKKAKSEYLFEPLFFAMDKASKEENFFLKEKAMMCIEFIYDKNNKSIPRGDHDNKEVKQVIDAITPFVVRDDRDDYLSLCQISSEGDYNHTKVYVMPEKDFSTFFSTL
ncbi:MAG: hypothetical protein II978_05175 [Clostridia bacterium]|nr:hypothetical protein [Clostridia bacterium]